MPRTHGEHFEGCALGLRALQKELDLWGEAGICADFWWRDDDAGAPRPELKQILDLTQDLRIPLHLAVVPSEACAESLADVKDASLLRLLPHGWSHANHESSFAVPSELGDARPKETVLAEIGAGLRRLRGLFGEDCVLPVLVPPWNSISPRVAESLDTVGIRGVSRLGARESPTIPSGLAQVNAHVDTIDWAQGPRFVGLGKALSRLVGHLSARRLGRADAAEPTGIMTHHWANDRPCWEFLASLGQVVNEHPAARWVMLDRHHFAVEGPRGCK